jgi:hypothetical protein
MKNLSILSFLFLITYFAFAQNKEYSSFVKKADSLFKAKEYKKAGFTFSEAFKSLGWKGQSNDRYNAACAWSLANYPDSSFFQINNLLSKHNFIDYDKITSEAHLISLQTDARWTPIIETIKQNKDKVEANFNKPLVAQLKQIYEEDQKYRQQLNDIEKQYGWDSKEIKAQWNIINEKDSINLIVIKDILDKYGWLGKDVVGDRGNSTLFLVIQHSDQKTQEKYLPMMRAAVKTGNAKGSSLALLEDRVALGQGKRQIYGSQIGRNPDTQVYFVLPLEDPDNVDKRRAEVGLGTIATYIINWQMKWDVEQYKKDLPLLEEKLKIDQK